MNIDEKTTAGSSDLLAIVRSGGMEHISLHTGHKRLTHPHEVHPEVVERLVGLIRQAENQRSLPMPTQESTHTIAIERDEVSLRAVIHSVDGGVPVATITTCIKPAGGLGLWRDMHTTQFPTSTRASNAPQRAWVASRFEAGILLEGPSFMFMLGDFERCLAWSFVEHLARS